MALTEKNYWNTPKNPPHGTRFARGPHRGFTGQNKYGTLYYKGRVWTGPRNLIGCGRISMTDDGYLATDATSAPAPEK